MKITIACLSLVLAAGTCGSDDKPVDPGTTKTEKVADTKEKAPKKVKVDVEVQRVEIDPMGPGTDEQIQILIRAKSAFLKEDWKNAEKDFQLLTQTGPISGPQVTAFIALAQFHRDDSEPEKAVVLLEELQKKAANVAEVHFMAARTYNDIGESTKALKAYEKTLKIQPDYLQALVELGGVYIKVGREEEGAKLLYNYEQQVYKLAKSLESKETAAEDKMHILDIFSFVDDDRANQAILAAISDGDANVRYEAIDMAIDLKLGAARKKLKGIADNDPVMRVRMLAKDGLKNLEGAPTTGSAPNKQPNKK